MEAEPRHKAPIAKRIAKAAERWLAAAVVSGVLACTSTAVAGATACPLSAGGSCNASTTLTATVGVAPYPIIDAVSPSTVGPGTTISISGDTVGAGFSGGGYTTASVTFNGVPATSFIVISPTQIVATVPTVPAGTLNVVVTLTTGYSSITAPGYTAPYNVGPPPPTPAPTAAPTAAPTPTATPAPVSPPLVTGAQPAAASAGTLVTVAGANFSGAGYTVSQVTVGGVTTSYTVLSSGSIQFVVPSIPPGPAAIIVTTTSNSGSLSSAPFAFTVMSGTPPPPPPTITGISPTSAQPGQTITILGGPFSGAGVVVSNVTIGGQSTEWTIVGGHLQAKVPNIPPGPASIVVIFSDNTTAVSGPGVTFRVAGTTSGGPPAATGGFLAGAGAFFASIAKFLPGGTVTAGFLILLLLATLIYLVIWLVRRRQAHEADAEPAKLRF